MSGFINNKYVILDLFCVFVEKHTLRKSSIIFKNEHNFEHNLEKKSGTAQPRSQDFFPFFKFAEFKKGKKSWERGWALLVA